MHDALSEDYRDMIHADTAADIEKRRKAFLRKRHLKCRALASLGPSLGDCKRSQREGSGCRYRLPGNGCERSMAGSP